MFKRLAFIFLMSCIFPVAAFAVTVDNLYVFGDSLSDNGNLYAIKKGQMPVSPPYYKGRFSNGPVWVEDLTPALGLPKQALHDYAVGGAQTLGGQYRSYTQQIQLFLQQQPVLDPQGLYVIWIGANDYLFNPQQPVSQVATNIAQIIAGLQQLSAKGARYFLIPNLPDLSQIPWATAIDAKAGNHNFSQHLHALSLQHNQALTKALKKFAQQHPQVKIISVNAEDFFASLINDPATYQLTNVILPCYPGTFDGAALKPCAQPKGYLFWDAMHPTTGVQQQFANFAKTALNQQGIN